jgi:hypothetical protein
MQMKLLGTTNVDFDPNRSTDQFYIRQILEKKWEYNGTVHQLFIDFKKAYDSARKEVLYNIVIEFGIPRKLVGLMKTCLNETCSTHGMKHTAESVQAQICLTSLALRMA